MKKVYDYCIFFANGTREDFYLDYGPERGTDDEDTIMFDIDNKWFRRFHEEANEKDPTLDVMGILQQLCDERSLACIIVNPPREIEE